MAFDVLIDMHFLNIKMTILLTNVLQTFVHYIFRKTLTLNSSKSFSTTVLYLGVFQNNLRKFQKIPRGQDLKDPVMYKILSYWEIIKKK